MPLVLINPEVKPVGPPVTGPEGCLSFPEIFADITRPDVADVTALNLEGKPIEFRCGGLLARVVQHEPITSTAFCSLTGWIGKPRRNSSRAGASMAETKAALRETCARPHSQDRFQRGVDLREAEQLQGSPLLYLL